jgi:hypothetical protein
MKKKLLLFAMALFAFAGNMMAEDNLNLSDATIMQGKTGVVEVSSDMAEEYKGGFEIHMALPEGLSVVDVVLSDYITTNYPEMQVKFNTLEDGETRILAFQVDTKMMTGNHPLASIFIKTESTVEVGEYEVTPSRIEIVQGSNAIRPDGRKFKLTVIPYSARLLDETATEVPAASAAPEDVIINRSLKAGNWSTICLPFALNADQIAETFGADATIAEFIDHETSDDETTITVNFESITEMEANYPYIIKVAKDLKELKFIDVVVDANEEDAVAEFDNGKSGRLKKVYSKFVGVMHATTVPDKNIYLSGNKFYCSANDAPINAFRGYFQINDFEELYSDAAAANINILVDGEATAIENITINGRTISNGDVYTVSGMYMGRAEKVMNQLPAGIYIVNNKKVIVK